MPPALLDYLVAHEPLFRTTRLPSLYSDLSVQKRTNPEGYTANATAWTAALTRLALAGRLPPDQNIIVLRTGDALLDALASPTYGPPHNLGCVLDDGVARGVFIEGPEFLGAEKSIYARSWVPSPRTVLRWGLRTVGVEFGTGSYKAGGGKVRTGTLVVVPALEEVSNRLQPVIARMGPALTNRVVSREAFAQKVGVLLAKGRGQSEGEGASISDLDLQVLLRYLSRDKQLLSYDAEAVKFKSPASSTGPEPITQEDRSIASLKSLIENLWRQTTSLSERINTLQTQAAQAVKMGNKTSALSALRSKKLADRTLQSRLDTLAQLEEIYTKVESAVSQVEILAVMESSASALKTLNARIGGVERVEDVLDSLRDEVSKVDEVSNVLSEPGAVDQKALLDEADVDDELEQMEREERQKVHRAEEEKTRERLQQLEALEQAQKEQEREREKQREQQREKEREKDEHLEDALSSSIEKIRTLDIEDLRTGTNATSQAEDGDREMARLKEQKEREQRHSELVAQEAS
jgi:charged multivesicular body protein 7